MVNLNKKITVVPKREGVVKKEITYMSKSDGKNGTALNITDSRWSEV